ILLRAELDGIICSGPRRGNQLTFALLEERVPPHGQLTGDEALVELTRRYFASHGPATLADFVWWSGLSTTDARRGIALLGREIETIKFRESVYWISPAASTSSRSAKAHLLPAYDEYNVAYKDRQLVFDQDPISQITNAGAIGPTVIINGKIISTWKATAEKKLKINLGPSRALQEREEVLINEAAKRYAVFHGLQLN
ncbi:MAG TPA: crosslink repair DNA glycosylase YcaQ family protein, partial [Pyrinomonadaceae bacterium]